MTATATAAATTASTGATAAAAAATDAAPSSNDPPHDRSAQGRTADTARCAQFFRSPAARAIRPR
jgi:hypothetical protein